MNTNSQSNKYLPQDQAKSEVFALADEYAQECYKVSKLLPKEELFGITSQLRRASLSVPLNIVEGHARSTPKNRLNFSRMSYGSLKESQYLLYFILNQKLVTEDVISVAHQVGNELSAKLWRKLQAMEQS